MSVATQRQAVISVAPNYRITTDGRVFALPSKTRSTVRELKQQTDKNGYKIVCLQTIVGERTCKVHRLVATAFIPNPDNKRTVNHIDENKTNNHLDNLEWATHFENNHHSLTTTYRHLLGGNNRNTKLVDEDILDIRLFASKGFSAYQIAKVYNMGSSSIYRIIKRETWRHI